MVSTYTLAMAGFAVVVIVLCLLVIVPPSSVRLAFQSFERRTGTPPAVMAVASVFALVLLTLGIAGSNTAGEFGVVDGLLSVAGALGPLGVVVGLTGRTMRKRLSAASDCSTGNPDTGVVAVDGALRAVDGTFDIPDTDGGVLSCAYALQKDRGFGSRPAWVTIAEGERTRPLALDDGSGELRVDEDGVSIHSGQLSRRSYSVSLPESEPVPDEVAAFLAMIGVESPDRPSADHRLRLRPLNPGNTVTVVGEYGRVTKAGDAFWGVSDGDGPAYLFPGDLDSVRSRLARRSTWLIGGGTAFTLVGVGYVATLFVP
ncbi:hypothetical protein [Halolamina salifodinae]|uniref:Na+-transporting methylmalonyl-CoA/oxaloacetate decarboxylase gamma subunit n=1 Tax=Halolamina salifodinae TaxID=1202767 RepID=A0A8T4GZU0_9EURY|nr:hypothetical protein [Halolamina salifodinae]MBP1987822.1 Na+-transporting methylmalonyl-CoA/oxaloacetate decarboxylase gamma subunit [Halolamina salifodinae]